jgi:hypothetical protein
MSDTVPVNSKPVELLIITDQIGSSRNITSNILDMTKRHFEKFVSLLKSHRPGRKGSFVVKNVGDSLMIRVICDNPKDQVPKLLLDILKTQNELRVTNRGANSVNLRVIVMLLKDFIDGKEINWRLPDEMKDKKVVPLPRWNNNWLSGDVFGPGVALAFRAAGIIDTREPITVVDDNIIALLNSGVSVSGDFSLKVNDNTTLYFSKPIAFSPFKGLEELYPFAQPDPKGGWWKGHLFLRVISDEQISENPLLLLQQKVRVFLRFFLDSNVSQNHIANLVEQLRKIEGGAGYMRSIALVDNEIKYPQTQTQKNRFKTMLIVFAGPTDSTYEEVRKGIKKIEVEDSQLLYATSTFVYRPEEELSVFWPETDPTCYVLIFAKWEERNRPNPPKTFQNRLIIPANKHGLAIKRCGELIGEEWDIYSYLFPEEEKKSHFSFNDFASEAWEELKDGGVERATFYLCQSLLQGTSKRKT